MSFPEGSSVSNEIPKELSSVHYATIDDAIKKIISLGARCFLAKTDIKLAFPIIPLYPRDFDWRGLEWEGKFCFDGCLPMGCSFACNIFETFSTALEWIASTKLQASAVIHILDDFLFLTPSQDQCHKDLDNFIKFCSDFRVPIADYPGFQRIFFSDRYLASRQSRVDETRSAEEKKITSGHRSTQPHFHARSGSNISPNQFWAPWEACLFS